MAKRQSTAEVAAPAVHVEKKSGRTVTVACKFPPGLVLQHQMSRKTQVPLMGGGYTEVIEFHRVGPQVHVRGPGVAHGVKGYRAPELEGGYALTHKVDGAFFDEWLKQNADTDIVRNKIVFAATESDDVEAEARDNESRVTGFEPVDPDGDWRVPKPLNPGVEQVKTADLAS